MKTRALVAAVVLLTLTITAATFVQVIGHQARLIHEIPLAGKRVDILLHKHAEDHLSYLARITRGQAGRILFRETFVISDHTVKPIWLLYTVAGALSGPFRLSPAVVYQILRVAMIVFFVWATYVLSLTVLKSKVWALVATIVALIVPIPPNALYRQDIAMSFTNWWNDFSVVGRLDAVPHHLAELACLYLAIVAFIRFVESGRNRYLVGSSIAATLAVLMIPQSAALYFFLIGSYILWQGVIVFRKKRLPRDLSKLLRIAGVFVLPLLAILSILLTTRSSVWREGAIWEIAFWQRDPWIWYHFFISFIFLWPLAYIGFVKNIRRTPVPSLLLGVWVIFPFVFGPVLPILKISSSGRIIQTAGAFVPLAILATIALRDMVRSPAGRSLALIWLVLTLIFASSNIYSYAVTKWFTTVEEPMSDIFYPPTAYIDAAAWVKRNVPRDATIVAGPELGSVIGAFAPVFVYVGDNTHGGNWDLVETSHWAFYTGKMAESTAHVWLTGHGVSYVVLDPFFHQTNLPYSFLTPLWQSGNLVIYKVK